jgi:hypothetical protein
MSQFLPKNAFNIDNYNRSKTEVLSNSDFSNIRRIAYGIGESIISKSYQNIEYEIYNCSYRRELSKNSLHGGGLVMQKSMPLS